MSEYVVAVATVTIRCAYSLKIVRSKRDFAYVKRPHFVYYSSQAVNDSAG